MEVFLVPDSRNAFMGASKSLGLKFCTRAKSSVKRLLNVLNPYLHAHRNVHIRSRAHIHVRVHMHTCVYEINISAHMYHLL